MNKCAFCGKLINLSNDAFVERVNFGLASIKEGNIEYYHHCCYIKKLDENNLSDQWIKCKCGGIAFLTYEQTKLSKDQLNEKRDSGEIKCASCIMGLSKK